MLKKALLVLLALSIIGTASAQLPIEADAPVVASPLPESIATPAPVVAEGFTSARATMRTFLVAFASTPEDLGGRDALEVASTALDLSEIPLSVRRIKAPELAADLKDILDRTELIDFETIPDEPAGEPWAFLERAEGSVTIARGEDGAWRFDTATVASIPALHLATEALSLVDGVVDNRRTISQRLRAMMPSFLRGRGFLLQSWQWAGLGILFVLGLLADRLLRVLIVGSLRRWLTKIRLEISADRLREGVRPLGLFATATVWGVGLLALGLPAGLLQVLLLSAKFVAASALVWAAYKIVDIFAAILERRAARTVSGFDDLLVPLVRKSLKIVVIAVGLVFVADNLQLDITGLLAGLGVGGIAVALAAQDTVKNLLGSLTVLVERPFEVGDWVKIGDVEGTVEELGFRSTRVRTFYNSLILLPNSHLISASIDNFGARKYRRWTTKLGLTYSTPPDKIEEFCEGLRELIRQHPYTRKDYFLVYLNGFSAHSVDILLYMFFETPGWGTELREKHRLGLDILRLAASVGVEFAFPTQTLHVRQDSSEPIPEMVDSGYRGSVDEALSNGRDIATRLMQTSLNGEIPPPEERVVSAQEDRGEG